MNDLLLEAKDLACHFPGPRGTNEAVKGLNLSLREGELIGLIGPDGAGKTTSFRMLVGLQKPTSGKLDRFIGKDRIAYVPQTFSLSPDLTVEENMQLQAGVYGLKEYKTRMTELLRSVDLEPFRNRMSGALSGGMKQKLALCVALLPDPRLLFLDEPTTGVDPVSRREFWKLLHEVHDRGVAILFSTPYMDEAEYAERMLLMYEGQVLSQGTQDDFQSALPGLVFKVITQQRRQVQQVLATWNPMDLFGEGDVIRVRFPQQAMEPLLERIAAIPGVERVRPSKPMLEDVFLHALSDLGARQEVNHG
jgi:ABC-2 type transport system ATP-binding protein